MAKVHENTDPITLTDQLRKRFKHILDPIGAFLNRLGLMPNTITIIGLVGNTIGAYFLWQGQMLVGGLIILAMGPVDALDGTMARLRGEPSDFGAFVDSVTDRYSELVIFLGLMLYYNQQGDWVNTLGVYLAAAGSVLVSYVRARAQSLGYEAKVGILTRAERYAVLAPTLIFNIPWVGVWIIAVLANITAMQRIIHVRRLAHVEIDKLKSK
ncbi:MAG: CDP-alcohol phosphatidyltransferase family protein [Anaerolineales bacterium]|jgi:CDP-diacylglycerol--glycerol-3-phosphate 3-phosphatidyltransferase